MPVIAMKLDADGRIVGHTIVPDLAALDAQDWPRDRYRVVRADQVLRVALAVADDGTKRRVYTVEDRAP
jgi:hypothetical protein